MILLDPELEPEPAPASAGAKRGSVPRRAKKPTDEALPTQRTLARFLSQARKAVHLKGSVSVLLTSEAGIRRLNRQFRGKNKATDVLSFPAEPLLQGGEKIAGDLAISIPTARRQAAEHGHALLVEIKVLILHGLLHLAGYDHETDAGQMARRERNLRKQLRLPLGLIERAGERP